MKRRIVSGGILALSLAVVLLAATVSTASAERLLRQWHCPPPATPPTTFEQVLGCLADPIHPAAGWFGVEPSFDFGDRRVGTMSPAQPFVLGVFDNDSLNPTISVSGDHAQTNNCPPTLSAGAPPQLQGCLINITFAPTGTGPKVGTLSTGPGGPTARLTGKGVTTPTPWDWPLELRARAERVPSLTEKEVALFAITNTDSTVVVTGGVKKTTQRLAAGEETKFEARIKHRKRLREEKPVPRVKIRFAATDEFDQTAAGKIKVGFCVGPSSTCR